MTAQKSSEACKKILLIRFSSFGDICQSLFAVAALKHSYQGAQVHFLTRSDFVEFLEGIPLIDHVWSTERKGGIRGLIKIGLRLRRENFDLVYDAHNNLRSLIISIILRLMKPLDYVRRSKYRFKRFLLFKFRKNYFPKPFRGGESYLEPLELSAVHTTRLASNTHPYAVLAPHATWSLKETDISFWKELVSLHPNVSFVVMGAAQDRLPKELARLYPSQVKDLSGKTTWKQAAEIVANATHVVGVDTGLTHLADYLAVPATFLIGPSAFGYPTRHSSSVLETDLYCKPCSKDGRGRCINQKFKKCMLDLRATAITLEAKT